MYSAEIIEAFGGYRVLAREVGVVPTAVIMWRTNGIPAVHCLKLARIAERFGLKKLTLNVIMESQPGPVASKSKKAKRTPPPAPSKPRRAKAVNLVENPAHKG